MTEVDDIIALFWEEIVQVTVLPCFEEVYQSMIHLTKLITMETTWDAFLQKTLDSTTGIENIDNSIIVEWHGCTVMCVEECTRTEPEAHPSYHIIPVMVKLWIAVGNDPSPNFCTVIVTRSSYTYLKRRRSLEPCLSLVSYISEPWMLYRTQYIWQICTQMFEIVRRYNNYWASRPWYIWQVVEKSKGHIFCMLWYDINMHSKHREDLGRGKHSSKQLTHDTLSPNYVKARSTFPVYAKYRILIVFMKP